jgi:hypothetical protein
MFGMSLECPSFLGDLLVIVVGGSGSNISLHPLLPKKCNAFIKAPMLVVWDIGGLEQIVLIHLELSSQLFFPSCSH